MRDALSILKNSFVGGEFRSGGGEDGLRSRRPIRRHLQEAPGRCLAGRRQNWKYQKDYAH